MEYKWTRLWIFDGNVGPCQRPTGTPKVRVVRGTNTGRYRVIVLSAEPPDPDDSRDPRAANEGSVTADEGWELVRSRVTKDGVSRLLVYRKSA